MPNPWDSAPIVQKAGSGGFLGGGLAPSNGFHRISPTQQEADIGGPQDPITAARIAAAEARARAAASTPIEVGGQIAAKRAGAMIDLQAEAAKAQQARAMGPTPTDEGHAKAVAGYQTASQLDDLIKDIEARYKEGPGSTKGVSGLYDYNPFNVQNQRFDTAGDAVRGVVGSALGFTGGQLNTPQEAIKAVGPYLPQASDRDEVIQDKIAKLKQLRDNARERAIGQLGGIPDANGRVTPVQNGSVATGATKMVDDPKLRGVVDAMLRSGASDDDINAAIAPLGGGPIDPGQSGQAREYLKKNPAYKGGFAQAQRPQDTTFLNRAAASPVGSYFGSAADALTAGNIDSLTGDPEAARRGLQQMGQNNPTASLLGAITGGALAAGGVEAGLGGLGARGGAGIASRLLRSPVLADAVYGGAYGAGSNDADRLTGAVVGTGAGVGGGMFGRGLARGIGGAATGVRNGAVDYLRANNIPLTVGQTLSQSGIGGRAIKGLEDRLSGIPVVGDMVNARRLEGIEGMNRAAFDQGLAPIGATTNGVIGEQGIDAARAARSQAYRNTLDPVNVTADAPFVADMAAANQAGNALPDPMRGNAQYTLPTRVGNSFGPNGELTGRDFQQSIRGLRRDAASVRNQPYGYDFGQVTEQAENALEGLLQRQSPQTIPAYQAANAANRNVEILKDAVNRGRNGTRVGEPGRFAASQLADAAAANARRFGGGQGTTNQPFFDLTRAAQQVLPSSVPDSGTAGRLATLALPAGLAGAGAGGGYASGDVGTGAEAGLGVGALLALGGTRAGQRTLTRILSDRPDLAIQIGEQINRRSRIGGMFGAGLGVSLLPQ